MSYKVFVGVISYLPDDVKLRSQRLCAVHKQYEWLTTLFKGVPIYCVAQSYNDNDYIDNINYIKYNKGIGAGNARNVILTEFYNSDCDWLFLCDDDTTSYEYYNYRSFINDVINNENKFSGIDAISALEPEYYAYKKLNYMDRNNLTHYKFEPRVLNSGSATSVIRNIKKFYGKELYFSDVDANKGEGREDIEFLIAWLKNGFTWYTMVTWIRKSLCFDKSSIFGSDTKARDRILMHDLDVICQRYKQFGINRVNGKITWKNFNTMYNKSKKVLYIPREQHIIFEENVIPKLKTNAKKLF